MKNLIVVLMLVGVITRANGQESILAVESEGSCGSGFTESLVPEELFSCNLSPSCKAHDVCYGKCDHGGSLEGNAYCGESEFSLERIKAKASCDAQLYQDIVKDNILNPKCKWVGAFYASAVTVFGQKPFNGRPIDPSVVREIVITSNSLDEVKAKATALATLSQQGTIVPFPVIVSKTRLSFIRSDMLSPEEIQIVEFVKGESLQSIRMKQNVFLVK